MTKDEAMRPFSMMSANWPFMNFSDEITFELWFGSLEHYLLGEVVQGVKDAIDNIQHTPNVAEVREYVEAVRNGNRNRDREAEILRDKSDAVACWECNDHGFINIIFPDGTEAVRACNCQAANRIFGKKVLEDMKQPLPRWKEEKLFGTNEIPSQYKLVRVSRKAIPSGRTYKDKEGKTHQQMVFGYVPYFPRGGKEEVFMQYQKVRNNG